MDETQEAQAKSPNSGGPHTPDLVNAFIEITSSSNQEALFFLESHNFNLDAAVSTFLESAPDLDPTPVVNAPAPAPTRGSRRRNHSPSVSPSPSSSPEHSPSRSRSQSPPASVELEPPVNSYNLRSRRSGNKASGSLSRAVLVNTDFNRPSSGEDSGSDSDESEEYCTDGKKSVNDVEALFNQARQAGAEEGPMDHLQPSSRPTSFSGRVRKKSKKPFQGSGRTLGSTSCTEPEKKTVPESTLTTDPPPPLGLVVDQSMPSTAIQLRLVDGTRLISSFNLHHTISDIRSFIDASRPDDGQRAYQLQVMGFPPKQLTDLNQTIEEAGLANTVVIQKL